MYQEMTIRRVENGITISVDTNNDYKQFVFNKDAQALKAVKLLLGQLGVQAPQDDPPF
jgi:hypothetical protein